MGKPVDELQGTSWEMQIINPRIEGRVSGTFDILGSMSLGGIAFENQSGNLFINGAALFVAQGIPAPDTSSVIDPSTKSVLDALIVILNAHGISSP